MSREIEKKVGNLLNSAKKAAPANTSAATSRQENKQSASDPKTMKPVPVIETYSAKESLNAELKQKQDKIMVICIIFLLHGDQYLTIYIYYTT